jgi:hypothetical protein
MQSELPRSIRDSNEKGRQLAAFRADLRQFA